jgi:hypothetical protein
LALVLFVLGPITLPAWATGQAVLRVTGLRWWKFALASAATLVLVVAVQGGLGPALAHHFAGYLWFVRQIGHPVVHLPTPGAFLWPQVPLSVPVGLLAAALNLAGRRQAIDPAEARKQQRESARRVTAAVRRATNVRDHHWGVPALGVAIDGDFGWADRHGLVVVPRPMQGRSRLIVGTSGTSKTTDLEREAFLAARAGRKFFLSGAAAGRHLHHRRLHRDPLALPGRGGVLRRLVRLGRRRAATAVSVALNVAHVPAYPVGPGSAGLAVVDTGSALLADDLIQPGLGGRWRWVLRARSIPSAGSEI